MANNSAILNFREIAEEIIERSPSIAIRVSDAIGKGETLFITENISSYGYSRDDFMSGRIAWIDVVHPDDKADLINLLKNFEEVGNDRYNIIYRMLRADETPVWISDSTIVFRDEAGKIRFADRIITDYTETKDHIERIGENFRQQAVLNDILLGLHDSNLDKALQIILDKSGDHLDISRAILFKNDPGGKTCHAIHEWCNKGVHSMMEQSEFAINYHNDIPEIIRDLERGGHSIINYGEIPPGCVNEFENEGVIASACFPVTIQDEFFGFICFDECFKKRRWRRETIRFMESVSRLVAPVIFRQRNEELIQSMALTDQLTGLYNRHHLETCLTQAIARARESGQSGYLIFIDMDDFKIINDAYGHDYGDAILKDLAAFLRSHFGDSDHIFRFGGDEFVILLEPEKAKDIYDVMGGLLQRAQLPWNVLERTFYCTLSVGVVRFPEGREDSQEIIKNADIAMYQAKKMGKNNYVFYTSTLDNDSIARAEMENAMRESIDNGFEGFEVYFQPLTDMDKKIIGAEALIRWTMPNGKRLSPAQFIPLAEYLGLIIPIGEYVLRSATRCCREINKRNPEFFVSVNVSIRQFKQPEYMEKALRIIDEEGVKPSNVVLEITEGMAIHDMQRMKLIAEELRKRGVLISMDDFGTGYSSLGNMRELPIDVVKIDRSFIHDVTRDTYSKSFIRFISDLVHSMGREICIEGVETAAQMRYCRECGADYVQGYFLFRPVPADELMELLEPCAK